MNHEIKGQFEVEVERDAEKVSFVFTCKDEYGAMMIYDSALAAMEQGSLVLQMRLRKKTKC